MARKHVAILFIKNSEPSQLPKRPMLSAHEVMEQALHRTFEQWLVVAIMVPRSRELRRLWCGSKGRTRKAIVAAYQCTSSPSRLDRKKKVAGFMMPDLALVGRKAKSSRSDYIQWS